VENPLSIPEKLIIALATYVERVSLILSNYMGEGRAVSIMSLASAATNPSLIHSQSTLEHSGVVAAQ